MDSGHWTPTLSDTNFNELQINQNACLRTSLGCTKMSRIDHLHSESKIMPVRDHCQMLSQQLQLANIDPYHANHCDINLTETRVMKNTLKTKDDIAHLIPPTSTNSSSLKSGIKNIHTVSVANTISNQENNPVINAPAPQIDKVEKSLGRKARSTLSQ